MSLSAGAPLIANMAGTDKHFVNVGCSFTRYTTLYSYFRSNNAKGGYRKRKIKIWTEFGRFKTTDQTITDQIRTITKNGWFSDLEILETHQQIYRQTHQQSPTTVTETINTGKLETPNQTLHDNDSCTTNAQTQTLTQEEKTNVGIIKRIMSEKKIPLLLSGTKTGE